MANLWKPKGGYFDPYGMYQTVAQKPAQSSPNCNNLSESGIYQCSGGTNAPFTGSYILETINGGSLIEQRAFQNGIEKVRYWNGTSWTGWSVMPHIFSGTSAPASGTGVDGDIYIQY